MEIEQLAATPISFTFRTKAFLDESENLVSLDTLHIVFPRWHHRDGESFSRAISSTKRVTSLRSVNISRFVNKEPDLDFVRTYIYHSVDRGFVIELKLIVISFSSIQLSRLLVKLCNNHICTSKYLLYCITITSNPNGDSFHAPNHNPNLNANPIYIYIHIWKQYTKSIIDKIQTRKQMHWLTSRKSKLSIENKLKIYKTIIKPIWTYGIPL